MKVGWVYEMCCVANFRTYGERAGLLGPIARASGAVQTTLQGGMCVWGGRTSQK